MPGDPFQIDVLPDAPLARAAFTAARPLLEWLLALSTYRALYRQTQGTRRRSRSNRARSARWTSHANVSAADLDWHSTLRSRHRRRQSSARHRRRPGADGGAAARQA